MALKNNTGHFLMRLAGLTGLMAVIVGLVLWLAIGTVAAGLAVTLLGAALLVMAALVEVKGLVGAVRSQRGAMGSNVVLQIVLALVLVVGVNVFSFLHYHRFDWTSEQIFTIPKEIRDQLGQLRGETDIVVYLRYTSSLGQEGTDFQLAHFQAAAQRKIVEKVKDLAEQFQELGPRFRVTVLNIQEEEFEEKVKGIKKKSPPLAEAIESAPENSIFFLSQGRVQRLGFHDIYQLDSVASRQANRERGNLVLNYQGVEPFARKILNIEEKKPRVAVAVVHPALSTRRMNPILTMNGARKTLEAHGFVCKDLLLRKLDPDGGLSQEPAALTYDENRFEQIEEELALLEEAIAENEKTFAKVQKQLAAWKNQSLEELQKTWVYLFLPNGQQGVFPRTSLADLEKKKIPHKTIPIDEEDRTNEVRLYSRDHSILERELDMTRKERDELTKEKAGLFVDELAEKRRITDVEAKMKRMLADADLLVVPRFTFFNLPTDDFVPNRVHKLDEAQLRAIRAFLKEGKPVMFLLGPRNEKREMPAELGGGGDDALEPMLADLGVSLPKQTVLFNLETKEFTEKKLGQDLPGRRELELPPLKVDWPPGAGQVVKKKGQTFTVHPLRASLYLAEKSAGQKDTKELQARYSRPVYLLPDPDNKTAFDESAVFLMAGDDSWNESFPFINEKREVPRYKPAAEDDPKKGTLEEVRRGPFPVAVAFEATLPQKWYDDKQRPGKARIAVIGNGAIFTGADLSPIKQKLLLDTSNWLLGREDLLAKQNEVWQYPRVDLSETQKELWHWGAFLGMPLLFVYVGLLVFMVRRMR